MKVRKGREFKLHAESEGKSRAETWWDQTMLSFFPYRKNNKDRVKRLET
jgi:hypothetical protein